MKIAKKLVCVLLAFCMMFALLIANGSIFSVNAATETVILDQNFESDTEGQMPAGWSGNTATPEPTPGTGFEDYFKHCVSSGPEGYDSKAFEIIGATHNGSTGMTHNLYQKDLSEAVGSITLTYDVYFQQITKAFAAILPVPLYTGIADAAYDVDGAPVQLLAMYNETGSLDLYFSLGKGVFDLTGKTLNYATWYTFKIEVDLSKENHDAGVKVSFGPKGGDLTEVDLPVPTKINNVPVWRLDATMDRISTGFYPGGFSTMYLDNIKATGVAGSTSSNTTQPTQGNQTTQPTQGNQTTQPTQGNQTTQPTQGNQATQKPAADPNNPGTADEFNPMVAVVMMLVAVAAGFVLLKSKKSHA